MLLSYPLETGSGETDRAAATSGDMEFCPRWETLGEMSQFLKVARLLPLGSFVLISLSAFARGIIRVSLIITPTERICMFFRFF